MPHIPNANKLVVIGLYGRVKESVEFADYVERVEGNLVKRKTEISDDKDRALLCFKEIKGAVSFKTKRHKFKNNPITVVDWYSDWHRYAPTTSQVEAALLFRARSNTGRTTGCQDNLAGSSPNKNEAKRIDQYATQNLKMPGEFDEFSLRYGSVVKETQTVHNHTNDPGGEIPQTNVQTRKASGSNNKQRPEHLYTPSSPLNPKSGSLASKGHGRSSHDETKRDSTHVNLPPKNQQHWSGPENNSYRGKQPTEIKQDEFGKKPKVLAPLTFQSKQGQKIRVLKTDITQMKVDAIVNAANAELKNIGGVAWAIAKSAGPQLQKQCNDLIATEGPLAISQVAVTKGYKLPAKYIIHVVGPVWNVHRSDLCKQTLYQAFTNCLCRAAVLKVSSIAVPAVSAAIYGGPSDVVAEQMCKAVVDFCVTKTTVTDIYLVDIHDEIPTYVASILSNNPDITIDSDKSGSQGAQYTTSSMGQQGGASAIAQQETSGEATQKVPSGNNRLAATSTIGGPGKMTYGEQASGGTNGGIGHNSLMQHGSDERKHGAGETYVSIKNQGEECAICMESKDKQVSMRCGHVFCQSCMDTWLNNKKTCPACGPVFGALRGNQPEGTMTHVNINQSLPGYEKFRTIQITYIFPDGTQKQDDPHPGVPYHGTSRTAYLPNSPKGKTCLGLLRDAFNARLLFTIGRSVTNGKDDQVIFNDVQHRTRIDGGSTKSSGEGEACELNQKLDVIMSKLEDIEKKMSSGAPSLSDGYWEDQQCLICTDNRWEETFDIITKNAMALKAWKDICRKLLDEASVVEFDNQNGSLRDKLYQIIYHWRERTGAQATRARLAQYLRALELNGCADKIHKLG